MNDKTHLLSRDISKFLLLSIGCLFIFFAYIIPKSKLNSVVGVRTTWSKKNELIWEKTQRFSGIAFGVTGIILIIGAIVFSKKVALIFMITIIVICVIISCTMSYYIYKKCINNKRL